jgi:hypothetical protein
MTRRGTAVLSTALVLCGAGAALLGRAHATVTGTAPATASAPGSAPVVTTASALAPATGATTTTVPVVGRGGSPGSGTQSPALPQSRQDFNAPYDGRYHFVRIEWGRGGGLGRFGRGRRWGGPEWAHDYPRADFNFLAILQETTYVRSGDRASNVVRFDDPELFRHPITYIVEVGRWSPSEEEVAALGEYLLKGGFLIVDDFRGPRALDNLRTHLRRAVPGAELMEVDPGQPIFDTFFRIVPDSVIPPYGRYPPEWYGVFEDNDPTGRLMVMINANNDIAEYWEFSDRGFYPIDLSNEAYKLGVNYVVYGLTR